LARPGVDPRSRAPGAHVERQPPDTSAKGNERALKAASPTLAPPITKIRTGPVAPAKARGRRAARALISRPHRIAR